jgi:hypothetical protein
MKKEENFRYGLFYDLGDKSYTFIHILLLKYSTHTSKIVENMIINRKGMTEEEVNETMTAHLANMLNRYDLNDAMLDKFNKNKTEDGTKGSSK